MLRFAKDLEDLDEPNSIWYRNNNDRLSLQNDSKRMLIREHLEEFLFGRSYLEVNLWETDTWRLLQMLSRFKVIEKKYLRCSEGRKPMCGAFHSSSLELLKEVEELNVPKKAPNLSSADRS